MEVLFAAATWLALGLPTGLVLHRYGGAGLLFGVLPFAGGLSLLLPIVAAAWTGGSLAGWGWKSILAAAFLAAIAQGLLYGSEPKSSGSRAAPRAATAAALLPLLAMGAYHLLAGAGLSQGPPTYEWDGYQIWLLRAKVLAYSDVFPTELFAEPQLVRGQWQYPLFLPAYLAWFLRSASLELRELQLPLGILAALLPVATWGMLSRSLRPLAAASVALAPLAVPRLAVCHYQAWADPLVVMALAAGSCATIVGVLRGDRPRMVAGGFALASVVAIKNDGILWLAAVGGVAGLLLLRRRPPLARSAGDLLCAFLPGLLLFAAWDLTCRQLGLVNSLPLDGSAVGARLPIIAAALYRNLFQGLDAFVIPLCAAAIFLVLPGGPAARLRLGLVFLSLPLIYLAGITAVQALLYIPPPFGIQWQLRTSLDRLTLGVVPALFWMANVAAAVRPEKLSRSPRPRRSRGSGRPGCPGAP